MPKNQKHLPTNIIWVLVHKRRKTAVTIPEVHRVGSGLDPSLVHRHRRTNGGQPGLVLGVPLPVAIAQGEGRQEGVVHVRYAGDVVLRREKKQQVSDSTKHGKEDRHNWIEWTVPTGDDCSTWEMRDVHESKSWRSSAAMIGSSGWERARVSAYVLPNPHIQTFYIIRGWRKLKLSYY